jgi:hypothetical protein
VFGKEHEDRGNAEEVLHCLRGLAVREHQVEDRRG